MSIFIKMTTDEEAERYAKMMFRTYNKGMEKNKKEREARQFAKFYVPIYAEGRDTAVTKIAMNLVRTKKLTYDEIAEICSLTADRVKSLE